MQQNAVEFEVEINDVITPFSCSAMVVEFIKYIIYQKQLIPYPYERLKMYVNKRKKQLSQNNSSESFKENSKHSLMSRKYFKKTESAHESLENIFQLITNELTASPFDRVEEVVLLLGTSLTNPQDVFRLRVPALNYSHSVKYHSTIKTWRNLFRTLVKSEKFNDIVSGNICSGSLHVMLKMKPNVSTHSELFIPRNGFRLLSRGNHTTISFKSKTTNLNCLCNDFKIFEDCQESSNSSVLSVQKYSYHDQKVNPVSDLETSKTNDGWYQMKDSLKYFSDVFVNGISLVDMWMNPDLLIDANSYSTCCLIKKDLYVRQMKSTENCIGLNVLTIEFS